METNHLMTSCNKLNSCPILTKSNLEYRLQTPEPRETTSVMSKEKEIAQSQQSSQVMTLDFNSNPTLDRMSLRSTRSSPVTDLVKNPSLTSSQLLFENSAQMQTCPLKRSRSLLSYTWELTQTNLQSGGK